mmetsp:Transcript_73463/g.192662  ORF Transcript_73463/g.192662 Transcript_73463/m.192662 type:complete len:93 (-) Transcript_73463:158-436(-)
MADDVGVSGPTPKTSARLCNWLGKAGPGVDRGDSWMLEGEPSHSSTRQLVSAGHVLMMRSLRDARQGDTSTTLRNVFRTQTFSGSFTGAFNH